MFQVTTLDMNNVPTDDKGAVDYSQDFFGKETNLTVSGQLKLRDFLHRHSAMFILSDQPSALRIPTQPAMRQSSG